MKKGLLYIVVLCFGFTAFAQNKSINYKAQLKDDLGNLMVDRGVTIQFAILQGETLNNVYQEIHNTITSANGIVILNIGEGNAQSGDAGSYDTIDWSLDNYFLNVQVDAGSGFVDMGTSEFKAVPYALYTLHGVKSLNDLSDARTLPGSIFIGEDAGNNSSGDSNIGIGKEAMRDNTIGAWNVAMGVGALKSNTEGEANTALGWESLTNNTTGYFNVGIGFKALQLSTLGFGNVAIGALSLSNTTESNQNVAVGLQVLHNNTSGSGNVGIGTNTLFFSNGNFNVGIGHNNMIQNSTGNNNAALGYLGLSNNTIGNNNASFGAYALSSNTTGNNNVAVGYNALSNLTTGNNNIAIGGNAQVPNDTGSNQIRMGNASITNANIQVAWAITSDKTWKENIRTLPYGLDFVKQLKPVDYTRKNNASGTRETGFIAQDVEELLKKVGYTDQGMLIKDDDDKLSLRYNDFIAILVKALQEQQALIESQSKTIEELKITVNNVSAQLNQSQNLKQL